MVGKQTRMCMVGTLLLVIAFQTNVTAQAVPHLIAFGGTLKDRTGQVLTGVLGISFAIYKDQSAGAPLWIESQNVQVDLQGRYTVLLGVAQPEGLPMDLFTSGESRWLGVQAQVTGEDEQQRVLLTSVPYALKAGDADTIGGKPASAFILAPSAGNAWPDGTESNVKKPTAKDIASSSGTAGQLAKWTDSSTLGNSIITEQSSNIGIGTTGPRAKLDVAGSIFAGNGSFGNRGVYLGDSGYQASLLYNAVTGNLEIAPRAGYNSTFTSGNVGIGTTAPGAKLDVKGDIWAGNQGLGNRGIYLGDSGYQTSLLYNAVTGNLDITPRAGYNTTFTSGNVILAGNVGIGTTSPNANLEIGGTNPRINIGPASTTSGAYMGYNTAGNYFTINAVTQGISYRTIGLATDGGNVGIGTTAPSAKLEVNGAAKAVSFTGDGSALTNVNASLVNGASAAALRTRGIVYLGGCDSCSVLQNTDSQATIYLNVIGSMTINSVTCYSDAGSPSINLHRGGSANNVLVASLPCSNSGATTTVFTGTETTLNLNDTLDFVMAAADGTAKRVTVAIKTTVN